MMSVSPDARVALWTAALRRAGVKLTHQRVEILRELAQPDRHPDADTLFQAVRVRVPTVSRDTVYRTLWRLRDLGVLTTLGPRQDAIRFDTNLAPHHHFVCVSCGLVRDLPVDAFAPVHVPGSVASLGRSIEARVEVRGVCAACEALPSPPPTPEGA